MSANLIFSIDGQATTGITDLESIQMEMDFSEYEIQPSITVSEFTFVNEARALLLSIIQEGRIFEGIPFVVEVYQGSDSYPIELFLDLKNHTDNKEDGLLKCPIIKKEGRDILAERTQANSFEYLESKGVITANDYLSVPYVVEVQYSPLEIVVLSAQFTAITLDLIDTGTQLAKDILTASGISAAVPAGPVGGALYSAGAAILNAIAFASNVISFITLGNELVQAFIPPARTHKAMTFKDMLEKSADYLGYTLDTDITELNNWTYLPSNPNFDVLNNSGFITLPKGTQKGIPQTQDYGNVLSDFFDLCKDLCRGRFAVVGDTLVFRNVDSDYWIKNSTYQMPSVLRDTDSRLNTDELKANFLISFSTDTTDEFTLGNFKGTNYERITDFNTNNQKLITGLEEVQIGLALGSRKDELNGAERALSNTLGIFDEVINFFGGNSNLAGKIKNRVGNLKTSTNNHSVPKILYIEGGKIPTNHRDLLSAKAIYESFYQGTSFIYNDFFSQKRVTESITDVPFGFDNFQELASNTYGTDSEGNIIEIEKVGWSILDDKATMSIKEQETYTTNLNETFIEGGE